MKKIAFSCILSNSANVWPKVLWCKQTTIYLYITLDTLLIIIKLLRVCIWHNYKLNKIIIIRYSISILHISSPIISYLYSYIHIYVYMQYIQYKIHIHITCIEDRLQNERIEPLINVHGHIYGIMV